MGMKYGNGKKGSSQRKPLPLVGGDAGFEMLSVIPMVTKNLLSSRSVGT